MPDSVFEEADEVELVDLPPDDLLERLREGKVYVPHQAERAIENFFTKGNLIALRELALRKAAERVGAQMEDYREEHGVRGHLAGQRAAAGVRRPQPFFGTTGAGHAADRRQPQVLPGWRFTSKRPPMRECRQADREQLSQTLHLAEQLGGETATLSGHNLADELIHYARSRNVTKIIVGKPHRPRWQEWLQGSLVYEADAQVRRHRRLRHHRRSEQRAAGCSPHGAESHVARRLPGARAWWSSPVPCSAGRSSRYLADNQPDHGLPAGRARGRHAFGRRSAVLASC